MLLIGFPARFYLSCLYGITYSVDLGPSEALLIKLVDDLSDLTPIDHAGFLHFDFYIGFAGESNYGKDWQRLIILENPSQCTDVTGVLQDGVVELVLIAVDVLCPVFCIFSAIYPAVVVLGFDDKNAID